ncbi:MAG: orotate phosphoribosyltransferase [Patescibacteria group bacterium]
MDISNGVNYQKEIARALLNIGAVDFKPKEPITFKSGIISPVYCDNRKFPFYPFEWKKVIDGFKNLIEKDNINFDCLAGAELAGIPHSSALGFALSKPSVMVRKQPKDHGTGKRVEGGDINGKKVLMLEDLVSTGSTSISMIETLRKEGGQVSDCLIIVTYGFTESVEAFEKAGVKLHALTSFFVILEEALVMNKCTAEEKFVIEDWFNDPHGWGKKQGF